MSINTDIDVAINALRNRYMRQALDRGYCFELDYEKFKGLVLSNCYYSNHPPAQKLKYYRQIFLYTGIDRKDNKVGYTVENSVPCCAQCNRAKSGMSYDKWIDWLNSFEKHCL